LPEKLQMPSTYILACATYIYGRTVYPRSIQAKALCWRKA